jgi:hypothetical protein
MLKAFLMATGVLFWVMVQIGIVFALALFITALGIRKFLDWQEKRGKFDKHNNPL